MGYTIDSYYETLEDVLKHGNIKEDRTNNGTISLTGQQIRSIVGSNYIPIISLKKTSLSIIATELAWMVSGLTNVKYLETHDVKIWNKWADKDGNLGLIYGYQWRVADGIDQIKNLVAEMNHNKYSRRLIVNSWNVNQLDKMNLPPCHNMFQLVFNPQRHSFDIIVNMRSADMFLGVPYNLAFYSLLGRILNDVTGHRNNFELVLNMSDCHIYKNHKSQTLELIKRYRRSKLHSHKEHDVSERLFFNILEMSELKGFKDCFLNNDGAKIGTPCFSLFRQLVLNTYFKDTHFMLPQIKAPIAV